MTPTQLLVLELLFNTAIREIIRRVSNMETKDLDEIIAQERARKKILDEILNG